VQPCSSRPASQPRQAQQAASSQGGAQPGRSHRLLGRPALRRRRRRRPCTVCLASTGRIFRSIMAAHLTTASTTTAQLSRPPPTGLLVSAPVPPPPASAGAGTGGAASPPRAASSSREGTSRTTRRQRAQKKKPKMGVAAAKARGDISAAEVPVYPQQHSSHHRAAAALSTAREAVANILKATESSAAALRAQLVMLETQQASVARESASSSQPSLDAAAGCCARQEWHTLMCPLISSAHMNSMISPSTFVSVPPTVVHTKTKANCREIKGSEATLPQQQERPAACTTAGIKRKHEHDIYCVESTDTGAMFKKVADQHSDVDIVSCVSQPHRCVPILTIILCVSACALMLMHASYGRPCPSL
jgi:hypothetical protein